MTTSFINQQYKLLGRIIMHTGIYYKLITPFKSTENNKYNYVYQITELSTGKRYIGSRGSTTEPKEDIKKYKSSSKDKQFKLNQKLNPLNYWYEILSYHSTREDANIEEARLHELYDVGRNDIYLNKSKQTKNGFSVAGKISVKNKFGNTMQVSVDDERYLNGDLISVNSGKITVMDKNGVTMQVSIDDERYLNGDLKHTSSGKITVVDKNGNTMQVSKDDERFLNGDLIGVNSGKISVMDKNGNTMQVSKDDERYLNGELQHICSGKISVMDKNGVTMQVSKDDERYLNGDLKHVASGVNSGKISVMDKNGNTMQVSKDDERYLNGDLIGANANWLTIEGEIISSTIATKKYKVGRSTVLNRVKSINPKWSEWKFL